VVLRQDRPGATASVHASLLPPGPTFLLIGYINAQEGGVREDPRISLSKLTIHPHIRKGRAPHSHTTFQGKKSYYTLHLSHITKGCALLAS